MSLKVKTQKRLDQIIRRFVSFLKYRAVGPQSLTNKELKDLVRAGLITGAKAPGTAVALAYLKTHTQIADGGGAPKSTREGALDFLERMFSRYTDKAGEQFSTDIIGQIEAQIMPFSDRTEGKHIYGLLRDKKVHSKYLGHALNETVKNWTQRWKLIVNTELARASNYGAMDAILHNNKGTAPNEIMAYKIGPLDGITCDKCREFWFTKDGNPKVYPLSELMANGTNMGKKQKDWKPNVDITHVSCRHKLAELKPGYGFVNGSLEYIGEGHDELLRQKRNK